MKEECHAALNPPEQKIVNTALLAILKMEKMENPENLGQMDKEADMEEMGVQAAMGMVVTEETEEMLISISIAEQHL